MRRLKTWAGVLAVLGWCGWASAAHAEDPLEQAYQREISFLLAERDALQRRKAELQGERSRRVRESEARVDGLQGRLLALEERNGRLEGELEEREEALRAATEREELLAATLVQAHESLGLAEQEGPAEELLITAIGEARARASAERSWRREKGVFFLGDGRQTEGEILRWGSVAAWGTAENGSGSLIPLGEGRLGLRRELSGSATATTLIGGGRFDIAELYIFEGEDKAILEREEQTLEDTMEAGGAVGWVIMGLGALVLVLVVARSIGLLIASRKGTNTVSIGHLVDAGKLHEALAALKAEKGPSARVACVVIEGALQHGPGASEALQDLASAALLRELPALHRFGGPVMVIAAVAPLLGLLGTVTGMIATFDIITEFGTGDPKMLSGGISEALVTTEFGLIVAIPAVLLGNLTKGWAEGVQGELEGQALELLNRLRAIAGGPLGHEPSKMPTPHDSTDSANSGLAGAAEAWA